MTDGDDSSDDEYKPIARAKSKKKPKSPHSHKKKKGVYGATGSSVDRRGTINRSVDAYTGSPWRWHVLFVMAMLNMLNNVVCFTFSPIAHFAHSQYGHINLALLVSVFFITNVLFSYHGAVFVENNGLKAGVFLGALLQAIGCWIRCGGFAFHGTSKETDYTLVLIGQAVASLSQPFITNTPPTVSAAWFPDDERAFATGVAVGFNEFGVAVAFISATQMVSEPGDIPRYLVGMAVVATILLVLVTFSFWSRPEKPPSASAEMKAKSAGNDDSVKEFTYEGIKTLLATPGFAHTLMGFTMAETVLNVYSTFLNSMLHQYGYTQDDIGFLGTAFFIAVMIGGPVFGLLVGRRYKSVLVVLTICSTFSVLYLQYSSKPDNYVNIFTALCLIGFFVGPTQPLFAELGVEVAFPASENLIFALQQIGASLFSAVFALTLEKFENPEDYSLSIVNWVMLVWLILGVFMILTFNATLKRPRHIMQVGAWTIDVVSSIQAQVDQAPVEVL